MSGTTALTWAMTLLGLLGFYLAGKKVWWAWYINIANQLIWATYSVVTQQWAFLVGVAFYMVVFCKNAYLWTRDRNRPPKYEDFQIDFNEVAYSPFPDLETSRINDELLEELARIRDSTPNNYTTIIVERPASDKSGACRIPGCFGQDPNCTVRRKD